MTRNSPVLYSVATLRQFQESGGDLLFSLCQRLRLVPQLQVCWTINKTASGSPHIKMLSFSTITRNPPDLYCAASTRIWQRSTVFWLRLVPRLQVCLDNRQDGLRIFTYRDTFALNQKKSSTSVLCGDSPTTSKNLATCLSR